VEAALAWLFQKYTLKDLQLNVEVHVISWATDTHSRSDLGGHGLVLPLPHWPEHTTEGQRMLERKSRCVQCIGVIAWQVKGRCESARLGGTAGQGKPWWLAHHSLLANPPSHQVWNSWFPLSLALTWGKPCNFQTGPWTQNKTHSGCPSSYLTHLLSRLKC